MQANALIFALEGLFASGADQGGFFSRGTALDANPRQHITDWLYLMKCLLRTRGLRDATDWEIAADSDVVAAGSSLDSTGGTVYGWLVDSIYDVAENLIVTLGNVNTTIAVNTDVGLLAEGSGAQVGAAAMMVLPNSPTTTTAPSYDCAIFPMGLVFDTAIFAAAIGDETNVVTANDVRTWIIYRSDVEVRQV